METKSLGRIILITGATSGFGEAMARRFAAEGWRVIISGRRRDRLDALSRVLDGLHGPVTRTLRMDVRDRAEVERAISSLPASWSNIDVLVNNAGLARGFATIQEGDPDDWDVMIDTNVKGLLYVTRAVVPAMVQRGAGHIINIGSTAGKDVYPKGNVYAATKFAVDALTKSMRLDLLEAGIKVTQVAPGAAETEFSEVRFHGDKARAEKVYEGFQPLSARDVADIVLHAASLPPHVCMNDIVVTALAQANSNAIVKK